MKLEITVFVLFAVVGADYCFSYIDVGCNVKANDSSIFRDSAFNIELENNMLTSPNNGVLVDDAFPLRKKLTETIQWK
jgi:hypothetical protein